MSDGTKRCFDCGKVLSWTGSGPAMLNREQWDAIKAGDYFARCENATHPNGNCYFWDNVRGLETLKRVAAPAPQTRTFQRCEME